MEFFALGLEMTLTENDSRIRELFRVRNQKSAFEILSDRRAL